MIDLRHQINQQTARARRLLQEVVQPAIYTDRRLMDVAVYQCGDPIPYEQAIGAAFSPVQPGFLWGPLWSTAWFRLRGPVPAEWAGQSWRVLFDTRTEACCWWEGSPYQGVELHRQDIKLPDTVQPGDELDLYIEAACNHMLGVGTEYGDPSRIGAFPDVQGGVLKWAHLARYHPERAALASDLDALIGLTEASVAFDGGTLENAKTTICDPARSRRLLATVQKVCRLIDHHFEGNSIDRDLAAAREACSAAFQTQAGPTRNHTVAVGHAHIDLAWLWPIRETKRKASRTFSTVIRYMQRHPEYRFVQTMPQLYEWVRQEYPGLFRQILDAIKRGQWEVGGAMWVEPDCNIPCGESFCRQLLYGMKYCQEVLGTKPTYLFLPDVFGYSAALPQLIKLAGLDAFITQKISWNDTNRFPHHSFNWFGQDGTAVLSHFLPANDYNATNHPAEIALADARYAQSGAAPAWLQCYGHGDGGGGPTEQHLERINRLGDAAGMPNVQHGRIDEFVKQLGDFTDDIPEWHGELYLELHRGTYTVQSRLKWLNRRLEDALRDAELAAVMHGVTAEWREQLENCWKVLLLNQFHDILPGSSINWVMKQAVDELEAALKTARQLRQQALPDGPAQLSNPVAVSASGVVTVPETAGIANSQTYLDFDATPQQLGCLAGPIGAYGSVEPKADRFRAPANAARCNGLVLDNGKVRAEMDHAGRVVSLMSDGVELVSPVQPANQLVLYSDLPRHWDAWDIDADYIERLENVSDAAEWTCTANGPLRAELEFRRPLGVSSQCVQRISLDAEASALVFETQVQWSEGNTLLRVLHPVNVFSHEARYETQFGYLSRPTHRNTTWDAAKFEVCAQRWMDLSGPDHGVSLLNDSKYGHSCLHQTMGLSLLRSAKAPDPHADMGTHRFRYALMPHAGFDAMQTTDAAERFNRPVQVIESTQATPPIHILRSNGVRIDTIKPAEDGRGIILRLYECRCAPGTIDLRLPADIKCCEEVNLLEKPINAVGGEADKRRLSFKPFEVKTLRLT